MLGAAEDLTCLLCKNIHALPRKAKLVDPPKTAEEAKPENSSESKTTQTSDHSDSEWNGLLAKRPKRPRPSKEKIKAKKDLAANQEGPNLKKKKKEKALNERSPE